MAEFRSAKSEYRKPSLSLYLYLYLYLYLFLFLYPLPYLLLFPKPDYRWPRSDRR